MTQSINDQLVLIGGESGTGKSASLQHMPRQEGVMYLNCESGKRLPFKNSFKNFTITDPLQVPEAFDFAQGNPDIHTIVIDSITFLMDMFETQYVLASNDTQKAWGQYAQFFKQIMQQHVAASDKSVIFLGHTKNDYDEKAMEMKTRIAIKGAIGNGNGAESYFSTVVAAKKVSLKDLEPYGSDLLNITEQDEMLGFKHVFQTGLTKATIGERIRSPMGLFTRDQTFMDNDCALLLSHLEAYYS